MVWKTFQHSPLLPVSQLLRIRTRAPIVRKNTLAAGQPSRQGQIGQGALHWSISTRWDSLRSWAGWGTTSNGKAKLLKGQEIPREAGGAGDGGGAGKGDLEREAGKPKWQRVWGETGMEHYPHQLRTGLWASHLLLQTATKQQCGSTEAAHLRGQVYDTSLTRDPCYPGAFEKLKQTPVFFPEMH